MSEEVKDVLDEQEEVNLEDQLDDGEMELARKHGLIEEVKEEEETSEASEKSAEVEVEVEEEKEEEKEVEKEAEHSEDLDEVFDKMSESPEKEFEGLQKFNKTDKAFYWKWKNDKKKRQTAEAEAQIQSLKIKELESRLDALSNKKSTDPLEDLLKDDELEKPVTKAEYEADKQKQIEAQKRDMMLRAKARENEVEAKNKYEDYTEITKLAGDIMDNDKTGTYWNMFIAAYNDPNANAAEVVYKIGRLHQNANKAKVVKEEKHEEKKVDKINRNLQKKSTSAAMGGAGEIDVGKKAYSELTWKDAASMSTEEWMTVPRNIRDQLLKASCV